MSGMLKDFIAGGGGGLSLLAVGQPFDIVKVRMQTQSHLYKSSMQCVTQLISKEGPLALYKGAVPMAAGIAPVFALSFLGFGHGKQIFGEETIPQLGLAGAWSAVYTTPLIGSGERIKCVAQTTGTKYGHSDVEIAKNLYKETGAKGLLKGMEMTLLRDGVGSALYFGTYEYLKKKYLAENNTKDLPIGYNLLYGGLAGWAMWSLVMPVDTIKSRIQVAPEGMTRADVLKEVRADISKNGIKTVYRGVGVVLARAFPANAACFLGYEKSKQALNLVF